MGNTIATRSSDGKWSVTLCDAEQRGVFTHQDSGDWQTSEYDEAGLLTKTTHHPATGANEVTEYKYDANGRQIEVLKDGKKISGTEYAVSSSGARSVTQIDQNGNKSITETDSAGRTVREAFEGVGGARRETRYGYDADGRRNYVLSPNGLETRTAFDAAGREIETKTRAGGRDYVTRKGYDRFGRLVWSQDPQQASVSPALYTTYLYVTDHDNSTNWTAADDCSGVTDPRYGQLAIVFHADDDQNPLNNESYIANPPSKSFEMYAYDAQGRQTDVVKPASLGETSAAITTTTTSYDEKGQVAAVIMNHRNDATTDSQTNLKFVFHYDSHGNRSEVVYPSGVVKQWNYKYNSNDELTSMTETQVGAAGAPASWKTTTYDPTTGLSSALIDAVGNTIASQYDSDSMLKKKIYTSAATPSQPAYNVNYSYDSDSGQLKEVKTYAGAGATQKLYGEAREYDNETGGLAKVSKESGGVGIGALNYAYNNTGALASISWLGRSVAYEYDEFGRMKTARANEADWEYTYAPCGKKSTVHNTRANEMETREYDGLGRLKSIEHKNDNDNRIIFRIDYRLGPDGNRVGAFERRQTADDDIATSWSYTYDPLGRLIRERRSIDSHYNGSSPTYALDRDVSYEYDRDSNRLASIDHRDFANCETYTYVANTQRLAKVAYSTTKYTNYSWTDNGELAREDYFENSTLKNSKTYTWGIGGTLIEVRFEGGDQDGCKVNYEYDSDNELIGRKVTLKNGSVSEDERYLVDHQNPTGYSQRLAVLNSLTGSIRHEIFTDELAAETSVSSGSSNTQYPHADGLGSVRALTGKSSNGSSTVPDSDYNYTAFGVSIDSESMLSRSAFTGQRLDPITNSQYHRARWLATSVSRWLSCDEEFDFPINNGNSYCYVGCSPQNYTDVTGTFSLIEIVVSNAVMGLICGAGYGAAVGVYREFFTPAGGEKSFWAKMQAVLDTMIQEAFWGMVMGAIMGPVFSVFGVIVSVLMKFIKPLLGITCKFAGQPIEGVGVF